MCAKFALFFVFTILIYIVINLFFLISKLKEKKIYTKNI